MGCVWARGGVPNHLKPVVERVPGPLVMHVTQGSFAVSLTRPGEPGGTVCIFSSKECMALKDPSDIVPDVFLPMLSSARARKAPTLIGFVFLFMCFPSFWEHSTLMPVCCGITCVRCSGGVLRKPAEATSAWAGYARPGRGSVVRAGARRSARVPGIDADPPCATVFAPAHVSRGLE